MMRPRTVVVVLAVLAIDLPATASAPTLQYEQFDSDAVEIRDRQTSLVWDRKRVVKQANPGLGQSYCDGTAFPASNGRVPTVKELLTLVDEDPHIEYDSSFKPPNVQKYIDQNAFAETKTPIDTPYWTSTPGVNPGDFWTVDFRTGKTAIRSTLTPLYVRCVR